uniref:Uncharacterized protein n=1 Tax=Panagrolaimus sp. ES5 TaxID=591445 RepID=A0AC34GTX6_9BILA
MKLILLTFFALCLLFSTHIKMSAGRNIFHPPPPPTSPSTPPPSAAHNSTNMEDVANKVIEIAGKNCFWCG